MITGPRYKICRRLGSNVFEKCQTQQYALSEQKHSRGNNRRRGQVSDFARQLLEKQRVRFGYGISERQLRKYIEAASRRSGGVDPATKLYQLLETRLDNVIFRSGIAATRRQARQLVAHGHIRVNGRKMTVPSYSVAKEDAIEVRPGSQEKPFFTAATERMQSTQPAAWVHCDPKAFSVKLLSVPGLEGSETLGDLPAVLEFYSR